MRHPTTLLRMLAMGVMAGLALLALPLPSKAQKAEIQRTSSLYRLRHLNSLYRRQSLICASHPVVRHDRRRLYRSAQVLLLPSECILGFRQHPFKSPSVSVLYLL